MNDPVFTYRIHGLNVACPFELPAASVCLEGRDQSIDVCVTMTDTQTRPPNVGTLFRGENAGTFTVINGTEIRINPDPTADTRLLAIYVLGSGIGRILQQRGVLTLHAAGVLGKQGVMMILGASGTGKSTLCASVATAGFATMGDDVLGLWPDKNFEIAPSDLAFKLSPELLHDLNPGDEGTDLGPVADGIAKHHIQVGPSAAEGFHAPVSAVILGTGPQVALRRLDPLASLAALDTHRYRPELQDPTELAGVFRNIAQIVSRIPVYELTRPKTLQFLPETKDEVIRLLTDPDQPIESKSK